MATHRSIPPGPSQQHAASRGGHLAKTSAFKAPQFFTTTDPRIAWEHFRPAAQRIETNNLQFFRNDVHVALHNVSTGLTVVEPIMATLAAKAPHTALNELLELPSLGLALSFAIGRCPAPRVPSTGEINAKIASIIEPREVTVGFLRMFSRVHPDRLPVGRVAVFGLQKGPLGMASDCVQAAGMFHEFASVLDGKHPFDARYLADMAAAGSWLITTLKPGKVVKRSAPRTPESIERDQFANLFEARHDALRTAGVVLFGIKNVDEKVPPLYSAAREITVEEPVDNC